MKKLVLSMEVDDYIANMILGQLAFDQGINLELLDKGGNLMQRIAGIEFSLDKLEKVFK